MSAYISSLPCIYRCIPAVLILLSSVLNFGDSCCEKQGRISDFWTPRLNLWCEPYHGGMGGGNIYGLEDENFYNFRPMDCSDLFKRGYKDNGVYTIWPVNRLTSMKRLQVYCDMKDGGWTVIQRRGNFGRANDFFHKDWESYKKGFGDLEMDFWLGNDNIFALTNQRLYSVYFDLQDKQLNKAYSHYDNFWIDDESSNYTLHVSGFSGTAGDALSRHNNKRFTTKDQGNEKWPADNRCSIKYKSGWWFHKCYGANLNGFYNSESDGIIWYQWTDKHRSLLRTEIEIKPAIFQK